MYSNFGYWVLDELDELELLGVVDELDEEVEADDGVVDVEVGAVAVLDPSSGTIVLIAVRL